MRTLLARTAVFLILASVAAPAIASTIVWTDPVYDFTVSYPDSWRIQTEDGPYTRLRVAGPYAEDMATCSIKVNDDGRAKIYPKDLVDEAVSQNLGRAFWDSEIADYPSAQITDFYDPASMGNNGDATGIRISYVKNNGTTDVPMYGVLLGSIYSDKKYITACTSSATAYERWAPVFASILDSVILESRYHPFATGYYRDFLSDPKLNLPRTKPGTVKEPGHLSWWKWLLTDKYHK